MREQVESDVLLEFMEKAETVHVIYGAHQLYVPCAGLSVAQVKLAYKDLMNIADDVETYLNGKRVADDVILNVGDRIEFMRIAGEKGQDYWSKREFIFYSGITETKWTQLLNKGMRVVQVGDDLLMSDSEYQIWMQRLVATEQPIEQVTNKPQIDMKRFCVHWAGNRCELRNTKPFWLFERLSRRPGVYIETSVLLEEVWLDSFLEKNTVQQAASRLQKLLRKTGMADLVIDGTKNPGHYALVIKPDQSQ